MSEVTTQQAVEVVVSGDHMKAWLHLRGKVDPSADCERFIKSELDAARIAIDDAVQERIDECVKILSGGDRTLEKTLIAEGREFTEGVDARFVPAEDPAVRGDGEAKAVGAHPDDDASVRLVEKGAVLGRLEPAVEGLAGVDVHGNSVQPRRRVRNIRLGPNVRRTEDGVVAAETSGRFLFEDDRLDVHPVLHIKEDVDAESGDVDTDCEVLIDGCVRDQCVVQSQKSVTVHGAIEAAHVRAGGDIIVGRGILGKKKGNVTAGGCIKVKYCEEAKLQAGGDIELGVNAVNSELRTNGKLRADRAKVIGGSVHARKGVRAGALGSDADVLTHISISTDLVEGDEPPAEEQGSSDAIEKVQATLDRVRRTLEPLMADLRRLPKTYQEKAGDLLARADELEAKMTHRREAREAEKQSVPTGRPTVWVGTRICSSVVVAIGDRSTRFSKEQKGPVRIERRKLFGVTELCTVNPKTDGVTRLKSEKIEPPRWDDLVEHSECGACA